MGVLGAFHPSFEGEWSPENLASDFVRRMAARVRSGLLPAAKRRRNRYELLVETDESVRFRSTTLLTGANIGWNDVALRVDPRGRTVTYRVAYWTWARYCIGLGLALGLLFGVLVVAPVVTGWFPFPETFYPARAEVVYFGLPIMGFWCLVWPWVLIAMHKRPARAGFLGLLEEINSEATAR